MELIMFDWGRIHVQEYNRPSGNGNWRIRDRKSLAIIAEVYVPHFRHNWKWREPGSDVIHKEEGTFNENTAWFGAVHVVKQLLCPICQGDFGLCPTCQESFIDEMVLEYLKLRREDL